MEVVDGGDRGCGELLLVLARRIRALAPGSAVRLLTTDPAASVDLPAWCRLTGNDYLGATEDESGRACYDLMIGGSDTGGRGRVWWHPVGVTNRQLRVAEAPLPVAHVLDVIRDVVAVQGAAGKGRSVFRCT